MPKRVGAKTSEPAGRGTRQTGRSGAATPQTKSPTPQRKARASRIAVPAAIETEEHIHDGIRFLRRRCALVRGMHDLAGDPPLRRRTPGFEGLARIIIGQQLSVASAAAIWERFATSCPEMSASTVLAMSDDQMRSCGLSGSKIRTLRSVSNTIADGLDLTRMDKLTEPEVHAALTEITGIGPWTADIFIMFCLGRPDGFAPGDLALQIAAQFILERDNRLTAAELEELAERWRPWRGVAARLLWAYYKALKDARSGQPM